MNQIRIHLILFFFSILVFSELPVKSQDSLSDNFVKRYYFSVNVGRLFLKEARFSFEKRVNKNHIRGFTFGIKYSNQDFINSVGPFALYYRVSKGVYLGLTTAMLAGRSHRAYLAVEPSFGYYYFDCINYSVLSNSGYKNSHSYRSAKIVKVGLNYLIKYKFGEKQGKKGGLFGDFFIGFGGMFNYMSYNPPKDEGMVFIYPVIKLGIHLGFFVSGSNGVEKARKKRKTRNPVWKFQLYQD